MIDITGIDHARMPDRAAQPRPAATDFAHALSKHDSQHGTANGHQAKGNAGDTVGKQGTPVAAAATQQQETVGQDGKLATTLFADNVHDLAVQPVGVTESLIASRVFGVHQLAGRYLSELTVAAEQSISGRTEAMQSTELADGEAQAMPEATTPAVAVVAGNAAQTTAGASSLRVSAAAVDMLRSEVASGAGDPEKLALGGSTISWSERSLRFVKQADGRVTIWLRDYRLRDAETADVIDSALRVAHTQGMTVGKIMLNGSEAWSSRTDAQERTS